MDIASLVGLPLSFVLMIISMLITAKFNVSALMNYVDYPSMLITFGGGISAMLLSFSLSDFLGGLKSITLVFKIDKSNQAKVIKNIIDLSNVARKEGLLALEEAANDLDDPFMKKGILLIVDGTDPELVRNILETEITFIETRHKGNHGFWDAFGAMGPAWGMIGTLIGLVDMLYNMGDVSSIGPSMAVALITTFYGSVQANAICIPVNSKLKNKTGIEIQVKEVMIEGLLSIQAGENPRVIEEKLKAFLSPKERAEFGQPELEGGE